jgi:hypothetical protein
MTLEWRKETVLGKQRWTARNDAGGKWLASYDIATKENGEYRVWGLMRNRHQPEGERFVNRLDIAKAIAQDDYERRQRAEAWREYTETHDPPEVP